MGPPSRNKINFGLRRFGIVRKAFREHCREKRSPGNFSDARRAKQQPLQVWLLLGKNLGFLVREPRDRNITDARFPVEARRKPRAIGLQSLIARTSQNLPIGKLIVGLDCSQNVDDDALLIWSNTIDPIDEENRRSSATDLGQNVGNHTVIEAECSCEG